MPVCLQCKKEKSKRSFSSWVWWDTKGIESNGPLRPTCNLCYNKLDVTSKPAVKRLKERTELQRQEIILKNRAKRTVQQLETANKVRKKNQPKITAQLQAKAAKKRAKKTLEGEIQAENEYERELISRELSRRSLVEFIKRFNSSYQAGWVHEDICRRLAKFLRAIQAGDSPRLMLFMPPRHGKSMIASHHFPAWALGHDPSLEIIAASYGSSLPNKFSRQVRAFLRDKSYNVIFPDTRLDRTNEGVEGWSTTKGGGYLPAGVGGGITGKGAHCFIIDDPVKDAEEADSQTIRENIWNWWGSTAYTRLAPNAGVLVIQTRWHDDDLSGRMIMQMKEELKEAAEIKEMLLANKTPVEEVEETYAQMMREIDMWEIIEYPALANEDEHLNTDGTVTTLPANDHSKFLRKKNEPLHPQRFDYTRLMKIKRTLQPRHWSALYQQNPVPDEGMFFTKNMMRYDTVSSIAKFPICIAWDLAVGQKQQNDYTVGVVGCLDYFDRLIVLEVIRAKMNIHQSAEAILGLYDKYNRMVTGNPVIGVENGTLRLALQPHLDKVMEDERLFPSFDDTLTPVTDKLMRAGPLQGRMQQGKVVFIKGEAWLEDVEHELLRFPGGVHDDIVDALAWLARMFAGIKAPVRESHIIVTSSWRDKLKDHIPGAGKGCMGA